MPGIVTGAAVGEGTKMLSRMVGDKVGTRFGLIEGTPGMEGV